MFAKNSDGIRIDYAVEPGPRPVLLVHGFASNRNLNWFGTGWVRSLIAAGRGVVTVDLRGHGGSDKPHESSAYSAPIMAADVLAVLDDAGLDAVDVITYSMGGHVGAALAEAQPARVRRLVLGGLGGRNPFAHAGPELLHRVVLDGHGATDRMMADVARLVTTPGNDRAALVACASGMTGAGLVRRPPVPTQLIAGDADGIASDAAELAARLGLPFVAILGRTHLTAVTATAMKSAALEFLAA
ncbi:MAG: alpha/beta fold hydrolase [Jiangellaceae bacterium]